MFGISLRNTGASVWVRTRVGSHEEEGVSELAVVVVDKSGVVRRLYAGGTDFSDGREAQADDAMLGFIGALVLRVRGAAGWFETEEKDPRWKNIW